MILKVVKYLFTCFLLSINYLVLSTLFAHYDVPMGGLLIVIITVILVLSLKNKVKRFYDSEKQLAFILFISNLYLYVIYYLSFENDKDAILNGDEYDIVLSNAHGWVAQGTALLIWFFLIYWIIVKYKKKGQTHEDE